MKVISVYKGNHDGFKENEYRVAVKFLETLEECGMFVDLEAEILELTEPRTVCCKYGNKNFSEDDLIVILTDGATEAVNLTGNSGVANIKAIWDGICSLYDIYRMPVPKFTNERLKEMLCLVFNELEDMLGDKYEDLIGMIDFSDDELELVGYNPMKKEYRKLINFFDRRGFEIDEQDADRIITYAPCDDADDFIDRVEKIQDEQDFVNDFFDLDYEKMRIIEMCLDYSDAISEICDYVPDEYFKVCDDCIVTFR